jgi:hypothetical protein
MAFQQNSNVNGFGNNNTNNTNNQGGEKKKSNFRVGRIYGTDGTIDVSIWNSDKGGVYTILSIKSAVGKDPSTGANVYEQKMSGELPSIFMNLELIRAFLDGVKGHDVATLNFTIDTKHGSKLTMQGSADAVKITIENQKTGTRTITLDAVPIGNVNVHANVLNLISMIEICFKKALSNKLDPEEFAMAVNTDDTEVPFN